MPHAFTIGIDLGGTQIRAAQVNEAGEILDRIAAPTPVAEGPVAIIAALRKAALIVAGSDGLSAARGIGVACPGPLNTRTGMALGIPTLPGFDNLPVGQMLNDAFGRNISLAHDGVAAAVGEWRFGAARGCTDFVYVTVSTGIGGGVVAGGKILQGRSGMAGHIGHMLLQENGERCNCGRMGCWEAYASGPAVERRAAERLQQGAASILRGTPSARDVFEAAAQGDNVAQGLVNDEARFLGEGIVSLFHAFDPECVVLGGGVCQNFAQLQPGIRAVIARAAMPAFRDIPVVRAMHVGNSGLLGAAALAREDAHG